MRRRRSADGYTVAGFEDAPQPMLIDDTPTALEAERIGAVLDSARREGMLEGKTARISGRISPALIVRAKSRTGIQSDSELIEFALASLALDDDFKAVFEQLEGTVEPGVLLGY